MTNSNSGGPIPKAVALAVMASIAAWFLERYNKNALYRLDSMTADQVVQHQRALYHHSYLFLFVLLLVLGGFCLGAIEFIAYIVRLILPKGPSS